MKAAERDASWFRSPSKGGRRVFHALKDGRAACGQPTLLMEPLEVEAVPTELRCRRPGCKAAFEAHEREMDRDEAVDLFIGILDDLMTVGNFAGVSRLIHFLDVDRLDSHLIVTLLLATKRDRDKIPSRGEFVERCLRRLKKVAADRFERLVDGLI